MGIIKDRFKEKADAVALEIKDLLKEHGNKVIGEVTLSQIYQGMRGMTGLVSETSLLDTQDGIRFRGYSIPELRETSKSSWRNRAIARRIILPDACRRSAK